MKIVFSGAQCTGKTTILNKVLEDSDYEGYEIVKEMVRELFKKGLEINKEGDDILQLSIYGLHMNNLMKFDNLITDRGMIDSVAYSDYTLKTGKITSVTHDIGMQLMETSVKHTDLILYFPPEIPIVHDGVRDVDPDYQEEIHQNFVKYLNMFDWPKVVEVRGTIEERVQIVKDAILNLKEGV